MQSTRSLISKIASRRDALCPHPPIAVELADLRSFIDVAETLNIRRAASVAGVKPSTISRRIAKIKGELGVSVFERHSSGVRLTQAGRDFFRTTSGVLQDMDFAVRRAGAAARGSMGRLRIGIFASIASGFSHEALLSYRAQYPTVEIDIVEGEPRAHLRRLRERELDVAFLTGRHDLQDLDSEVMWSEAVVLAVASDHRFAQLDRLPWSELRGERFLVSHQEPGPEIYDWLTARLGGLGETTDIVRCRVARETLFAQVALGLGLTVVSEAGAGIIYPNILFKLIGDPADVLPFSVVWAPKTDNPALRRFLSVLRALSCNRPPPPVD